MSKDKLAAYVAALAEGRRLGKDKLWPKAIEKLDEAIAARPGEAAALAELAWARSESGDVEKARDLGLRALAVAADPDTRAMVLFNLGLVDEKLGDKDAARRHFAASYRLRASDAVKKRLEPMPAGPCDGVFATVEALRECLFTKQKTDLGPEDASPIGFQRKLEHPSLVLHVFKWGHGLELDGPGVRPQFLVSKVPKGFRKVAELGEDRENSAFGVHDEARFTGFSDEKIGGRTIVKLSWEQADHRESLGGLQVRQVLTRNVLLCVLGDDKRETTCPITVPIEETEELSYPLAPKDEALRGELAAAQGIEPAFKRVSTASFVIGADGKVTVTETAGARPHLGPLLAGTRLF